MPPPHENARVFILIILLFWLISSPDNGPGLISVPSITSARLDRQRRAHGVLNTTKWGDFSPRLVDTPEGTAPRYLNLTGFRERDGFAWDDLGRFKDRCLEWSRNANPSSSGKQLWDLGLAEPTWQNATGVVHGEWVRRGGSVERHPASYNLSGVTPGVSWVGVHGEWGRNVTGQHGKIILRLDEKDGSVEYEDQDGDDQPRSGGLAREIVATVTVQDDGNRASAWDMRLHGVHWPRQGAVLLSSTSEKFAGIFGLPHLTAAPNYFRSSQKLLNETLDKVLSRKERTMFSDPSNPWTSTFEPQGENWSSAPHCEYIVYAQIHPLDPQRLKPAYFGDDARDKLGLLVQHMEDELRNPTGAPIPTIPELQLSAVMWSPDCSFFLESKGPPLYPSADGQHLLGMKEEVFLHEAKIWLLSFAAVMAGQIYLLKGQIRESSTPSTIGRVSFYTAGIMLLADGLIFASASAWSLSASTTHLPSLLLTFTAFMSMAIGGAFLSEVYKIQEPERRNREREQGATSSNTTAPPPTPAAAAAAAATARAAATVSELPRPVTAGPAPPPTPPSPPIIIPSDQDIDAEIAENAAMGAAAVPTPGTAAAATTTTTTTTATTAGSIAQQVRATTFSSITGRFILLGTCLLFLSLAATSWPAPVRAVYVNLIAFAYLSLWVPQIWRNIQRNSRRAYSWRFTIGQSALRLLPFAYFYLRENNIVFAEPDPFGFALLAAWVWVQLWALAFQDVLGPRFGVPKGWAPEAWDYHPVLREDNLEAGGLPIGLAGPPAAAADYDDLDAPHGDRSHRRSSSSTSSTAAVAAATAGSAKNKRRGSSHGRRPHSRSMDCAICCEVLEVPVVPAGADPDAVGAGSGVAAVLARRAYMVTPCRHIFHAACLEGWLRFRLQCPICREELPPL
ncbi:hypothetical protein QBC33DRAFT_589222 [Phialemonium atrogriseum]|uniref:DSC E3 ubiquitin ligase complex subunit A n=1 Tax=Phialemonium atrogriseum TaxID=1093897 RepID=A0AAJ0BXM6_9PEZI|nr:uncharacterized protein QBC33DRAFT_589222 [Phialemonium atrogriseum]KAK1766195.1 hypothetical protein QBC33DRAFT_589222 [Phialemonium atrogriseum]